MIDSPPNEDPLERILAEIISGFENGTPPNLKDLTARHPGHRDDILTFVSNYGATRRSLAALDPVGPAGTLPRTFGPYELLEKIGEGSMGVVYKARHGALNRTVALKMMRAGHHATGEEQQRFELEAAAVARLNHPNIVQIYDAGQWEGHRYFTMNLIQGTGLHTHLETFRGRARDGIRLLRKVALAVRHAHQRAILHRDLKPANVLIDESGEPHVTDFGLAVMVDQDSRVTEPGIVVGTPAYMAPEQTEGDRGLLSVRADVYSLGAILYEMVTGRLPIEAGPTAEMMRRIREQDPPDPRSIDPTIHPDLVAICLKCLEKDPARRYENAGTFADDLDNFLESRPTVARPLKRRGRLLRWCRRNPWRLLQGTVVATLLLVLGGTGLYIIARNEGRRQERLLSNENVARQVAGRILDRMKEWGGKVETASWDLRLVAALDAWDPTHPDTPGAKGSPKVQAILEDIAADSLSDGNLVDWMILDREGTLIARAPYLGIVGTNFSQRDYFLGTRAHVNEEERLARVHVTKVFRSVADGLFKYNFCVPIMKGKTFLGVLALSGTTHPDFGLPYLHDTRQIVALVAPGDQSLPRKGVAPPDYIVLLHKALKPGEEAPSFLGNKFLPGNCERVCGLELLKTIDAGARHVNYEDPMKDLHPEYVGRWLASIVPVGRTGFFVVVQQQDD